jgi:hypothetical protein
VGRSRILAKSSNKIDGCGSPVEALYGPERRRRRDIVDLDATHAGPDAEAMPAPVFDPNGQLIVAVPSGSGQLPQMPGPAIALATPFKPANEPAAGEEIAGDGTTSEIHLDDEDDRENWLSVAAVEAEHKPKVIKTFDACRTGTSSFSLKGCRYRLCRNVIMGGSRTK